MGDIDAMSPEALKVKVRELLNQKAEDNATIADLKAQIGAAGGDETPAAASEPAAPRQSEAQMAEEMEKQKQAMIDAMLADGTISQEEYEEMVERNRREKEEVDKLAQKKLGWCGRRCLAPLLPLPLTQCRRGTLGRSGAPHLRAAPCARCAHPRSLAPQQGFCQGDLERQGLQEGHACHREELGGHRQRRAIHNGCHCQDLPDRGRRGSREA